jgi:predicted negative regulator of RcsB-dependent stress response
MPLANAIGYVTRANSLVAAKQFDAALDQAKQAVAADPDALQAQMALGDTLAAMHRTAEANAAYEKALTIAKTMEPAISAEWIGRIQQKMHA